VNGSAREVQTVLGPVEDSALGFVLVHEHVAASSAGILRSWPAIYGGRTALTDRAVEILSRARAAGVQSIVDCTTFDLGRDVELLAEVSARSGVTIIAVTGLWLDPSVTLRARSVEQLAELFVYELTDGIDGTGIRAGAIKIATEAAVDPVGGRILHAAALACMATNAPIITHTAAQHRSGELQAALLEEHGVDPARVAIGRSDDSREIDYLTRLADRGYWLAMDRIPNGALPEYGGQSVADRIDMIARLVAAGHANRILIGHDDPAWAGLLGDEDQRRRRASNPRSLTFISDVVLPAFGSRGIGSDVITKITVDNPRRWLSAA
jgi:phosphotriesterase-related protein